MKLLSRVWLFETLWTVAYKAPLSMEFSRQEYWSGLPFPSPGNIPDPGIKPRSPTLQADALLSEPPGKPKEGPERILQIFWEKYKLVLQPGTTDKAWYYCSLAYASTYNPLGFWVCGMNKGTGTGTGENTVIRIHQSDWLLGWKSNFQCKRYLNHLKSRVWT